MAFANGQASRILVDTFHLSTVSQKVEPTVQAVMLDKTVFTSGGSREFLTGIASSSLAVSGLLDAAGSSGHLTLLDGWLTGGVDKPTTIGMDAGFGVGSNVLMANTAESQFKLGAQAAGIATFDLTAETDGLLDFGVSLHDLGAETVDGSAAAVDNSAATTNGGVAHLHVTAFSGLTSAAIIVEHSTDNSTWATLVTFTTATSTTSQRIEVASGTTVRRYLRATVDVTGTGSATYAVAFARR